MITVPEASKIIVERSRYLSEALSKDLINLSSLARYIKPEIEEITFKKVTNASIIMALKRLKKDLRPKTLNVKIFKKPPQISVVTNLNLYRFSQDKKVSLEKTNGYITKINDEIVVLADKEIGSDSVKDRVQVSAIIISLPEESRNTPGVHYFFLKSLAWEGINLLETFSSSREYVLVFTPENIHRAFRIITSLFERKK